MDLAELKEFFIKNWQLIASALLFIGAPACRPEGSGCPDEQGMPSAPIFSRLSQIWVLSLLSEKPHRLLPAYRANNKLCHRRGVAPTSESQPWQLP